MTNKELLKILKQGKDVWNRWRKDKERMLKQIDALLDEAKRAGEQYPVYLGL